MTTQADQLLRSLASRSPRAAGLDGPTLLQAEADQLYRMLALGDAASARGADEALRIDRASAIELGKRIFRRQARALHEFLCGAGDEDRALRDDILHALVSRDATALTVLTGGLIAAFGMAPADAAIVAALVLRLVVAPTVAEVCATWTKALLEGVP